MQNEQENLDGGIIAMDKGDFELIPEDTHVARCVGMVHVGRVMGSYLGKPKEENLVIITWELPNLKKEFVSGEGEKPYTIREKYTLSMNKKANLRKMLESWRGKPLSDDEAKAFDISVLCVGTKAKPAPGAPCMIQVVHEASKKDPSKVYANIQTVNKLITGMVCPSQITPPIVFTYNLPMEEFKRRFALLNPKLQKLVETSVEYKQKMGNVSLGASTAAVGVNSVATVPGAEDDTPF